MKSIKQIAREHRIELVGKMVRVEDWEGLRQYEFDNVSVIVDRKNGEATFWGDLDNDGGDGVTTVRI